MAIRLRPISTAHHKETRATVTLPGPLAAELALYIEAYKANYPDAEASTETMIVALVDQFIANDAGFQKWKRERQGTSGTRGTRSRSNANGTTTTGTGTNTGNGQTTNYNPTN